MTLVFVHCMPAHPIPCVLVHQVVFVMRVINRMSLVYGTLFVAKEWIAGGGHW